jgi:hypothetical protein
MSRKEEAYSISVSFNQIAIFLFAIVLISFLTFILGYRAGKNSLDNRESVSITSSDQGKGIKELNFSSVNNTDRIKPGNKSIITEEIKQYDNVKKEKSANEIKQPVIKPEISARNQSENVYYYIQVGAFSLLKNAEQYEFKFKKLGYFTGVSPSDVKGQTYYRVKVGKFFDREKALRTKKKLEQREGKKFSLKLSR